MNYRSIYCDDKAAIVELFVGKSVKKITEDMLLLSDGTVLEIEGNEGCGGCSEGHYYVEELNDCENIIMNVEIEETGYDTDDYKEYFHIFVYAENRKINLLTVAGHDNGYYGSGYWIRVKKEA